MKRGIRPVVAIAALLVAAVVGLGVGAWWLLRDAGPGLPDDAAAGTSPQAASGSAPRAPVAAPEARPHPRTRARRPGEFVPTGDELWDAARRDVLAGRFLEALERIVAARVKADAAWKEKGRVAEILTWEDTALDQFESSMTAVGRADLFVWLKRLDTAVLDAARRKRLDLLRRKLVEAGVLDLAAILEAASAEGRRNIELHLTRFGGGPAAAGAATEPTNVDTFLRSVRTRNEQRPVTPVPLPVDDAATREQRRLEQLEKLRQRGATGLLDPIAAGLAWAAIHQADDGEVSDDTVAARCTFLGHTLCTSQGVAKPGQYRLSGTALAVLAWLDFRDQDLATVFEPSLSLGVSWLRKQMKADGSFPQQGYEAGIALMALGQAAKASHAPDLLKDVDRGMKFAASKVSTDGGFRYGWGTPGDLSVTGWYVQAMEQARDARVTQDAVFNTALEKFVRSVWMGDSRFKYTVDRPRESESLSAVGMLSLQILNPAAAEKERAGWTAALAASAGKTRNNLYATYYEVRTELAMNGALTDARQALLLALPGALQRTDPSAGGMFGPAVPAAAAPPVKGRKPTPPAWTTLGWVDQGGRVVATAFAVLTMEHALYRR